MPGDDQSPGSRDYKGPYDFLSMKSITPLSVRFERFFTRGDASVCWIWTGQRIGKGYGAIRSAGQGSANLLAHRLAWELANKRSIPDGLVVMHSCDNRRCVNPAHLSVGTHKDNVQDMLSKGRQSRGPGFAGSSHPRAKLSDTQVVEILSSSSSAKDLAAAYGVTRSLIYGIRLRRHWKHLTTSEYEKCQNHSTITP